MVNFFNTEVLGFIAAALTTFAFLPQVFKTWQTKKAEDVSFLMLIMFITGVLFWIVYAVQINSFPVLIANIMTLILNIFILSLKLFFRQNQWELNLVKSLSLIFYIGLEAIFFTKLSSKRPIFSQRIASWLWVPSSIREFKSNRKDSLALLSLTFEFLENLFCLEQVIQKIKVQHPLLSKVSQNKLF